MKRVIANGTDTISVSLAYARPNSSGGGISNPNGFILNVPYVFHALHHRGSGNGVGGTDKNRLLDSKNNRSVKGTAGGAIPFKQRNEYSETERSCRTTDTS